MTVRSVLVAAFAAGSSLACGGATADGGEGTRTSTGGTGAAQSAGGATGGARAEGGTAATGGGTATTGGAPAAGGARPLIPCPAESAVQSGCPTNYAYSLIAFSEVCSDDLWPEDGCHWAGTSCGLHSLMITRSSSYTVFCFYDEGTERLVGVSYFGKVNTCQSLDEAFPPEGFIRGECGNGSFDTPFG